MIVHILFKTFGNTTSVVAVYANRAFADKIKTALEDRDQRSLRPYLYYIDAYDVERAVG